MAESLETRQLLTPLQGQVSATARGTDPDGAKWVLRLFGPGALSVVGTNGDTFNASTQSLVESIDTITVGGAISTETRLVGKITPNPTNGVPNVYFQNLVVTPTGELGKIDVQQVNNFRTVQNGIAAIDMPDFYLAHTETTKPSGTSLIHSSAQSAGEILVPGGVNVLRFGGVNVDYTPPNGIPLNTTGQNNEFQINLGLPIVQGTSVIVNSVNSDAEANSSGGAAFQDYATFLVTGRLNLFQANTITGNTTSALLPTQLVNSPTTAPSPGGTYVISQGGAATGQIGDVRVGGNATNFTTFITEDPLNVAAAEGQLDAKISNYFIGGQTQNVLLVAPSGSRNISFGLGMDNVTINSLAVNSLRINRDAIDSNLTVERSIGNLLIGGDVTGTNIAAGQAQSLFTFSNTPPTSVLDPTGSGVFYGDPPPTITSPETNPLTDRQEPIAQNGGNIQARIAGSITNSIITASVDPNPSQLFAAPVFGPDSGDLVLPRGVINAKVEGTIDNSTNTMVTDPSMAFFARVVHKGHGPIIPPIVPYQPYPKPTVYHRGQVALKGVFKIDHPNLVAEIRAQKAIKKAGESTKKK
jgi:hypothetical protein